MTGESVSGNDGLVGFGGTTKINPKKPLPRLMRGSIHAYSASDIKGRNNTDCFALVCDPHLICRRDVISKYKTLDSGSLLSLVSSGICFWPPSAEERFVIVYENNINTPLMDEQVLAALNWKQEVAIANILKPLVKVFLEFKNKDFFHGNIRPSNIFSAQQSDKKNIILGDCLSCPAGYAQPLLYETIERSMAAPIARGEGTHQDDLYALGATLAVIMRSPDSILVYKDDYDLLRQKLELGSYNTFVGKDRFSPPVQELLKGLLHDDAEQRWNVQDLLVWLDGKRLGAKQPSIRKKAARALNFANKNHFFANTLAFDLPRQPLELARLVDNGDFELWLSRSLDDKEISARFEVALSNGRSQGKAKGYEDQLTSCIGAALAPDYPVYYRGLAFLHDGISSALAYAVVKREDLMLFHEMFDRGILLNWVHMQDDGRSNLTKWLKKFDNCRLYVKQMKMGFGLERCLYALSQNVQCLSPKLKGYFVTSSEQMVWAFEDMSEKNKQPEFFLDRHSAAFLMEIDARSIEDCLYDLNSPERHRQIMGNLRCLANLQKRYKLASCPNIARAFLGQLSSVYNRLHDISIRANIEENVNRFAKSGDLVGMVSILDNEETIKKDAANFKRARQEYVFLEQERDDLEKRLVDKTRYGYTQAQEFSAMVACTLALVMIVLVAISFFANKSFF